MKRVLMILGFLMVLPMFHSAAIAGQYDLKEMTPAVQSAINSRQARYDDLQQLKSSQAVGETNRGYVEVRRSEGNASSIVEAENRDRKVIYEAIASQNNLGPGGLAIIEKVFGEVKRDQAAPGELIQLSNGQWTQK